VAGALTDFPIGSVTKITEGRFYLSRLPEGMIALHWQCTHLGCTVPWVPGEDQFVCPCHGSQFDQSGRNLSGPAPRPLDYMPLEIHDGQVIVNTAVVRRRQNHLDEHITPV
jgi:cytochrome b6-f complex iron-sulfur subunit